MRLWCEKCRGTGDKEYDWETGEIIKTCEVCSGQGYTENGTIEHEIRVGKALIEFEKKYGEVYIYANDLGCQGDFSPEIELGSIEELLRWSDVEEER